MGRLTTHVLDTALGRPAAGIPIRLHRVRGDARELVAEAVTNDDGRCDAPVLEGDAFEVGEYEITFHAREYLARTSPGGPGGQDGTGAAGTGPTPAFLGTVPIRFGVNEDSEHYHVPLLLSPFGYSTYRGS